MTASTVSTRRRFLRDGLVLLSGLTAGVIGGRVSRGNKANAESDILGVESGEEIRPVEGSVRGVADSLFQEAHFEVIYDLDELASILLRLRDGELRPLSYRFDPGSEVALIAALGAAPRVAGEGIETITASEHRGLVRVQIAETRALVNAQDIGNVPAAITSPAMLVRFPRVFRDGIEMRWQTTVERKVRYLPALPQR